MERQTAGLLIEIRGYFTQQIPPADIAGTDLPDSARWFIATLQLFATILPEPGAFRAILVDLPPRRTLWVGTRPGLMGELTSM